MATTTLDRIVSSKSASYKYGHRGSGLPPQTVSVAEKQTPEWQAAVAEFFWNESRSFNALRRKDLQKYAMLDPDYEYKDHMWAVDPLNLGDKLEEEYGAMDPIQHYPIMNQPLSTIWGERINRPIQFYCLSEAPESRNEYYRVKGESLFEWVHGQVMNRVMQKLISQGVEVTEENLQQVQEQIHSTMMPDAIQKYMDKDYPDTIEQTNNRILKNLFRRNNLDSEFIEGFRHGTICGKEAYSIHIVGGKLKVMALRPDSVFYHRSPSTRWISESQYAGYRLHLTPSSIIDMWRDSLTVADIDNIMAKVNPVQRSGPKNSITGIKSISYQTDVFFDTQGLTWDFVNRDMMDGMIDEYYNTGSSTRQHSHGLIECIQFFFKSFRKVGWLETFDELDQPLKILVDENYEPDKIKGEHVEWFYLNQVYQGTCIDQDVVLHVKPYEHQIFDKQDPDYSPLPIEGGFYNEFNGKCIAITDLMLPWQELYDITAHELKKNMKKAIGKVMFMSIDNIPNVEGFNMEKWMYWAKEFGIAWVGNNNKNQGSFSHYSAQDMGLAQEINAQIALMDKIKINCDMFGGFSQSRIAGQSTAPTAAQDQQRLATSINQTEYYFWKHTEIIQRVLTQALNIAKKVLPEDSLREYLFDDLEQKYIDTDIRKSINATVGLYVAYGSEALTRREAVRNLALSAAGKTGNATDMADIILSSSENEIKMHLRTISRRQREVEDRNHQLEQQRLEFDQQKYADEKAWQKEEHYTTLQSQERQTFMKTFAFQKDNLKDQDASGTPDILESGKLFEQQMDNMRKHQVANKKLDIEERKESAKVQLENKKLNIEKGWQQVERENMENDLAISRNNAKGRGKG